MLLHHQSNPRSEHIIERTHASSMNSIASAQHQPFHRQSTLSASSVILAPSPTRLFFSRAYFVPPPPRYPPLSVSVHPFCSFSACFAPGTSPNPGSPLSALLTPSLLDKSPTPPRIPPLERVPPTPSAMPPWMAFMFLSPVMSVDNLSGERDVRASC